MDLVDVVGKRGTCDRGRSGCVIVKNRHILTTGYVGSAAGMAHCDEIGHQMKKVINPNGAESWHCTRTIYAEQNAICQAARFGIVLDEATVYCKMEPCAACAKMIVNSGIKQVVCQKKYHAAQETRDIFHQCGVKLIVVDKRIEKY